MKVETELLKENIRKPNKTHIKNSKTRWQTEFQSETRRIGLCSLKFSYKTYGNIAAYTIVG